jgi:hypothetical protein
MEAIYSFKTLVSLQNTRRYNPEDHTLHSRHRRYDSNMKSTIMSSYITCSQFASMVESVRISEMSAVPQEQDSR